MKDLWQRWLWRGGKSQQEDWDLQEGTFLMSPERQAGLWCFKARGETSKDVDVLGEWRWRGQELFLSEISGEGRGQDGAGTVLREKCCFSKGAVK